MFNVPWSGFEAQLALRGDAPAPRIAYLDGAMELMSPSVDHERLKTNICRLLETYAMARGIELSGYGGWTLRNAPKASGLEPDECYVFGVEQKATRPDLAIEVEWTHGGIDKLEIYRRLGVPEVWWWRNDDITIYVLREGRYVAAPRSEQLPDLDLPLLISFLDHVPMTRAMREYRDALRR